MYCRHLPLLDAEESFFKGRVDLSRTAIVCVQHLCSTTYSLFRSLFELGLKAENLYVLGKCYSTNPSIYLRLIDDGVFVSPASMKFESWLPYDESFDHSVRDLLKTFQNSTSIKKCDHIIILDDGGHLLEEAREIIPDHIRVTGIEQTSSGFNRLKHTPFTFPIVNTARSWLKLRYESPIIVDLVQRKLLEALETYSNPFQKILLIGYGALGRHTYAALEKRFDITTFDLNNKESDLSPLEFRNRLADFDIIIGCTGHTALKHSDFKYLKKGVSLASISSSDREFDAVYLRRQVEPYTNCHKNITVGNVHLWNSGFPITFGNDYDSIDTDEFQLTRALLLSSVCQAQLERGQERGFIDMNDSYQSRILRNFQAIYDTEKQTGSLNNGRIARAG